MIRFHESAASFALIQYENTPNWNCAQKLRLFMILAVMRLQMHIFILYFLYGILTYSSFSL
jgi:hypothetical protein